MTGRAVRADGAPAPPVVLLTYRLSGTDHGRGGQDPSQGATVVTRTLDRDFWTFSEPSNASGRYDSFFSASDKVGSDPCRSACRSPTGKRLVHDRTPERRPFKRLRSAAMDVAWLPLGRDVRSPRRRLEAGAIYRGLLVGVSGPNGRS